MVVRLHRLAHWCHLRQIPVVPGAIKAFNRIVFGVVLPPSVRLGKNVLISYQGLGTVIHRRAVIGDDTVISTGVTIGGRSGHDEVPIIEEGAFVGTGAKILGPITIGRRASIGANAVVLQDVPAFAVAVGVPARVVKINCSEDIPDYHAF